jgi:signal transduction histidine kinase
MDAPKLQRSFRRALGLLTSPEQIQSHMVSTIRDFLKVPRVALFLLDADGNVFVPTVVQGFPLPENALFYFDDQCVIWMNANRRHLNLGKDRLLDSAAEDEQNRWHRWPLTWLFPLLSLNRLTGFLALGGREFDAREIELLRNLVNLGGVALHNAALHRRQKEVTENFSRAEKLAQAGQLAAAAAHEIRNPLTAIRSSVQYVLSSLEEEDKRRELMDDVLEEVDRINGVLEGLLASVRPRVPRFQRIDLVDLIEKIFRPYQLNEDLIIHLKLDEACRDAICDPEQLRQVLLNLIQNAVQAMDARGEISFELRLGPTRSHRIKTLSTQSYHLKISDQGPGISEEIQMRIFDPFFTTKTKGQGTGLGLSICRGIIEKHGGEIHVSSKPGEGSCFDIELPINRM